MFRAQAANPMDDAVAKATDENLTSENWELILDVVDRVSATPSGPSNAVQALLKRLSHRNANVQLYTLELAHALSQNCGPALHRELASKAFTDALLRLAGDRNTHAQVKQKVLERMAAWTEEFARNPDFGMMEQAYQKLRREQPGLLPPSKPVKKEISAEDRRKEDEELQMALALSIKDKGAGHANGGASSGGGVGTSRDDSEPRPAVQQAQMASPSQPGTTAATVSRVRALYDFTPSEPGELAFRKNDIIAVLESVYKDWWRGSLRGQSGIFPLNYVEKLQDPTKEELERDAAMEAEVFGEMKNVERLLALLSGVGSRRGDREEEEIGELYQKTLSIRPKLIELIGKYSQKKDDFTQLNEKFIKARRDYEAMLESSMSQPPPNQYQQPQHQFPIRPRQPQYPPQQQHSYSSAAPPPQVQHPSAVGYPPQAPPAQQQPAYAPSYPPAQNIPPQQDVQRFYSPAPSEPPPAPQQQPPPAPSGGGGGYGSSPYPPQNGAPPPSGVAANGTASITSPTSAAAFHFIPGGLQATSHPPPPSQQQPTQPPPQPQQQPPPAPQQTQPQQEIRRKPSPAAPLSASAAQGPTDPYGAAIAAQHAQQAFQGQIRPNSIHTLNSGAPQELATGGYESPVENRHSYPPPAHGYESGYAPQQVQVQYAPQQQQQGGVIDDRDALPSRQRTHSFESPSSVYSSATLQQQQAPPQQQQHSGSSAPAWDEQSPVVPYQAQGQYGGVYQAYQPPVQQVGEDPGDYYR